MIRALTAAALTVLTLCAPPSVASAQAPAGQWEGVLVTPAGPIALGITLQPVEDGWQATFSLPAENVTDQPVPVEVRGDSVTLVLRQGVQLHTFADGDAMTGSATVNGMRMEVRLGRVGSDLAARLRVELEEARARARDRPLIEVRRGAAFDRIDADALGRLLDAGQASNSDAIVILHDGELVGAWYAGGTPQRIEAMSATKSIVSLAVGRLLTTGAIASLDVPVHHFYQAWNEGRKAHVTLRHLLNHTSGLHADRSTEAIYASDDFVRHALDSEITSAPGTEAFYNNSATNLVAGIVGRAAGQPMDEFLRRDLFARLGITDFSWTRDRAGNPHGMAGLQILPEDLARLGQLVLDRGVYDGERLIDVHFIDESLAQASPHSANIGLLWWLIRDAEPAGAAAADRRIIGVRADGYLGQYMVIYPEQRLVAVRMVRQSQAYDPEVDHFRDFQRMIRELIP
jgi:CubicO group peptidase (beta-lactamase class C family)